MLEVFDLRARRRVPLLIAFADLTRYSARAARIPDEALADTMDELYELIGERIADAGGRVIKVIGDAALIAFPEPSVDVGVTALLALKREADSWLAERGWDSRMIVKVHFGEVVAGPYGPIGDKRLDVMGSNVNAAARIESRGFALSAQAFRKLAPETRKRFKKHTPPITYIRTEDRHSLVMGW